MVRSLAHSPSQFAGIDGKRIAGNALVITLHAVALGVLMIPSTWSPPERPVREMTVVPVDIRPVELPKLPDPPPTPVPVERKPQPSTPPRPIIAPAPIEATPTFETGEIFVETGEEAGPPAESFEVGGPEQVTLAYAVAPAPRYPRASLRAGHEGTVILRVLVDEYGQPQSVEIERSSGHRELDRAAREQVLNRWRFQPAQRNGRAVPAYGLVPIQFTLP